ncbi:bucentaur or craniofacial development-domain-containing protein, partial [Scleroderma citrinum]
HPSESDSEDDPDYVPDDGAPRTLARRCKPPRCHTCQTSYKSNREREALWASFQASVTTPPLKAQPTSELVKIERRYLFAGKHVTEVVEVPANSEDAKKWPLWQPSKPQAPEGEASTSVERETVVTASTPTTSDTTPAKPAAQRRTGPRKPRTTLPSLPTSGSSKARKITTLDKSAMDWRAHVSSQSNDAQEELVANRRGGGYLDKVDFLQRVEERRQDVLDASKSSKRRKI